jgi:hypothetical protein
MLDHLSIQCADPDRSAAFYDTYYGGFVRDPDGDSVEAVCHQPN